MTSRGLHAEAAAASWIRQLVAIVLLALLAGAASAADEHGLLPAPRDLVSEGAAAAARGKPVIILFSLPGCSFCAVVRKNYLAPLLRGPEREQPVIREVDISGSGTFIDFTGQSTTHSAFASRYKARFAPTVLFLDRAGQPLAAPIVGGDTVGMYGGYLDNALADAARKLAANRSTSTSGKQP